MAVEIGGDGYGEQTTQAVYVGSVAADAIYLGSTLVYGGGSQPLTGVALLAPYDSDLDDILGISPCRNSEPISAGISFTGTPEVYSTDLFTMSHL